MSLVEGAIASVRFGLGGRPGEIEHRAHDPKGSLLAELERPVTIPPQMLVLPGGTENYGRFLEFRNYGSARAKKSADAKSRRKREQKVMRREFRTLYGLAAGARTQAAISTATPFFERWAQFWCNHFSVSVQKATVSGLAAAYEIEAIRPNVLGRFDELLIATTRHPAMLIYLDNAQSAGPNSRIGQKRQAGLNENLAREVLELHTMGVNGGYSQRDVEALARMFTGWSIGGRRGQGQAGRFHFYDIMHEPGGQHLLKKRYGQNGVSQGIAALETLARHPSTINHVCTKLARHFVADQPPASVVKKLAAIWHVTDGSLSALARALVTDIPEAWARLGKIRTPNELVIATMRATGAQASGARLVNALDLLGQKPWNAPSPQGWPDRAADWITADQALRRVEYAAAVSGLIATRVRLRPTLEAALGPLISDETLTAIRQAESKQTALTLLLAAPEFQRR